MVGALTLVLSTAPGTALAETGPTVRTVVDGQEITYTDVQPFIAADRTLVPMRQFLEALGATVSWEAETRTAVARLNSIEVRATIGEQVAYIGGEPVELEVPAQIVSDRTVIPLRFFAEGLGLAVGWDPETYTVLVDSRRTQTASRDERATSHEEETGGAAAPAPAAGETEATAPAAAEPEAEPATPTASEVVLARASELIGLPYAWGGTNPATGFDCSGLVYYLAGQVGVEVPRTSFAMYEIGTPVSREELRAGDLVFFTTYAAGASHVGIYDGNGGFIHAQSEGTGVQRTSLDKPWWAQRYLGARRIFE